MYFLLVSNGNVKKLVFNPYIVDRLLYKENMLKCSLSANTLKTTFWFLRMSLR